MVAGYQADIDPDDFTPAIANVKVSIPYMNNMTVNKNFMFKNLIIYFVFSLIINIF